MIKIRLCGLVKVQLPNLISKTSSSYFFLSVDDGNNVDIKTGYEKRNESVQSSSLKKKVGKDVNSLMKRFSGENL